MVFKLPYAPGIFLQKQELCFIQDVALVLALILRGGSVLLLQQPSHKCHLPAAVIVVHDLFQVAGLRMSEEIFRKIQVSLLCVKGNSMNIPWNKQSGYFQARAAQYARSIFRAAGIKMNYKLPFSQRKVKLGQKIRNYVKICADYSAVSTKEQRLIANPHSVWVSQAQEVL